jgi:arsenical pump membrane protein
MIWTVAAVTLLLILIRPWHIPESVWACAGAGVLVSFGLIASSEALAAVRRGTDVYLFLGGMMLLAELARGQGFFDWIAAEAIHLARGSRTRLFAIVYAAGTLVTIFLSNDATAVVLTPAVLAAVRKARATPLPYLLICAMIANAASFVLPISNPANLVVYGKTMPPLATWSKSFALPSAVAIGVTFVMLRLAVRGFLRGPMQSAVEQVPLSPAGKFAAYGLSGTAVVLTLASGFGVDLGLPTFLSALAVAALVAFHDRSAPFNVLKHISWSVLFLVAGLFVMVAAVDSAGALAVSREGLQRASRSSVGTGGFTTAFAVAVLTNLANNLPVGLIAGSAVQGARTPELIRNAILIGVDLGPNLSITGSLATILWLAALRREGENVTFFQFLRYGVIVMTPALAASVLALIFCIA